MEKTNKLAIKNISFAYPKKDKIIDNINFEVESGKCLAILGNNGAGKSTLLKCINGILKTHSSSTNLCGTNLLELKKTEMAKKIAFVSQKTSLSDMCVFDAVLLGRKPYIKWKESKKDIEMTESCINKLGLEGYELQNISELSGGELQKVMLAKALCQDTAILLLDEPTSNLDPKNQHEVLKIVREITKEKSLYTLIVLHDLNLALKYCDKLLFLKDRGVYSLENSKEINTQTIENVYNLSVDIIEHGGEKFVIHNG